MNRNIRLTGDAPASSAKILTPDALEFVCQLQGQFHQRRQELLIARTHRQSEIDAGRFPDFLAETASVRNSDWTIPPAPGDLEDRGVEITGPVDRKMIINALNSGAKVFMADFEDSLSPTWENIVQGQANLCDAVRLTIEFHNPDGRVYRLNDQVATLVVRPRGWHLEERHLLIDDQPIAASLFDFGLYFFHNSAELIQRGSGPCFYLPKLENHLEARLWADVFKLSEEILGVRPGSIRATVLIENILAAFEMDEILYELRDYAAGLNAGRWDYIFSMIKVFRNRTDKILPDRDHVTMTTPFMRSYSDLLVRTCHRRGAHAIGGMAAFIPSRDPEVNEHAFARVREDKERESGTGFDGTWVAHPALVPLAQEIFDSVLGKSPHQKHKFHEDVALEAKSLTNTLIPDGSITVAGVRSNISVALQYINAWLQGTGAAAINNL